MGVLDKILSSKRAELGELRQRSLPAPPAKVPSFVLNRAPGDSLHLLCEIKKRSPSAGALSTALNVTERARAYEAHGAIALSILCDAPFFDGRFEDLIRAREGCSLPLLCKEFILDECQLDAARAYGASAALLIVRCLEGPILERLIAATNARGLVALVEVFTQEECKRALDAGAEVIGVNARDLDTLEMDAVRARRVLESIPSGLTAVHLSGVKTPEDITNIKSTRADAALIGEVLMREDDPSTKLRSLAQAASA